jgi:hypothetical protein
MAQLLLDRPELTLGAEGLSAEEEVRLLGALGRLSAALGRAVRPAAAAQPAILEQAAAEVAAALAGLEGFFDEITYVAAKDEARPDFDVEGVFAGPVELSACLEHVPKQESAGELLDFCHTRNLLCLTLRREVTPQQLAAFLRLAGDAHLGPAAAAAGITAIAVVDRDELIPAKQGLSWRARIALSRLSQGLRDLPLYLRAGQRESHQVWAAVLREILHPLHADQVLTEFVLNADLAQTSGAGLERTDVQGDVVTALLTQQVRAVAGHLVHQLTDPGAGNVDFTWRERDLTLLRRLFPRLADLLDDDAVAILRLAVGSGLFTPAELPANLRDVLDTEQLTGAFLANSEPLLDRLQAVRDLETWRQFGSSFAAITNELIHRRQYAWASQVAEALATIASPSSQAGPRVRQLAGKARLASATLANLERMATHLSKLPADERGYLFTLLGHLGPTAARLLTRRLHETHNDGLRANLRTMLASLGKAALPTVSLVLHGKHQRPEAIRNLLLVLATMRDPAAYDLAAGFLSVEDATVRQAALVAVARMDGGRGEPELVKALRDPASAVRATALEALGAVGSRDHEFRAFLHELFEGNMQPHKGGVAHKGAAHELAGELTAYYHLLLAGCAAVASLAQLGRKHMGDLEPPLMRSLKKIDGGLVGLALRVLSKGVELDRVEESRTNAAAALVTALAWIGSADCLPVLRDACKYPDARVAALAERAIAEITARTG